MYICSVITIFTLLTHGGMYEDLKQLLGREVDLVVDGSLRPYAQDSVERDKNLGI